MILQQILAAKKQEIAAQKAVEPLEKLTAMCEVQPAVRSFLGALQRPGEVAVIAEIKRRSPACHTLVAGLSNDAIGYLPTRKAFEQGGYETTVGSTFYQSGSAERLVEAAVAQLEQLFGT